MTQIHAHITDEMLERARNRIGKVWVPQRPGFNTGATQDTIRHFVDGYGDVNPIYRDEEYAKKTKYGRITAPPCFLYTIRIPSGESAGLPGLHSWLVGGDWEWFKPILEGDKIAFTVILKDVEERPSGLAKRSIWATEEVTYKNQIGETVAKAEGWLVAAERDAAKVEGKYQSVPRAKYTQEEIKKIDDDYDNEVIRGSTPRYWETVKVGEALQPVVKGPLSPRDILCWLMGWGGVFFKAHRIFLDYQRRHPAIAMLDESTGAVDIPELVHMEGSRAKEIGIVSAYDYAPQRITWQSQVLTNWMGDDGFLKKLHVELRRFNMVGDTTWCHGEVTDKYIDKGEHLVHVKCWGKNQRDEANMQGYAVVALPSRG